MSTDRKSFYKKIGDTIEKCGWMHMGIFSTESDDVQICFDYTIGLTELDFPELLITAPLRKEIANKVLSNVIKDWEENGYSLGINSNILRGMNVELVEIDAEISHKDHTVQVGEYYMGTAYEPLVVQVVLPDPNGRLPSDKGYLMQEQLLMSVIKNIGQ